MHHHAYFEVFFIYTLHARKVRLCRVTSVATRRHMTPEEDLNDPCLFPPVLAGKRQSDVLAFHFTRSRLSLWCSPPVARLTQNKGRHHTSDSHLLRRWLLYPEHESLQPNVNCGVDGLLYENLAYVNGVTGQETPMLSTGHQYSADNLTLTFTIRQGVKWSDGQAFTAKDVAFTFNLLKQFPAADSRRLWQHFSSVTAPDANTVVMQVYRCPRRHCCRSSSGTYIVPQHLWATVGDPAKYTNTNPVGTGPMKLKSFDAQVIKYVKNPTTGRPTRSRLTSWIIRSSTATTPPC